MKLYESYFVGRRHREEEEVQWSMEAMMGFNK